MEVEVIKSELHELIDKASTEELLEWKELMETTVLNDDDYMADLDQRINEIELGTAQYVSWESIQAKIISKNKMKSETFHPNYTLMKLKSPGLLRRKTPKFFNYFLEEKCS